MIEKTLVILAIFTTVSCGASLPVGFQPNSGRLGPRISFVYMV
jgi:hypothetical protein